jgi:hypothetical protein
MRELVISRLTAFIANTDGYGIPRCFDCDEDDYIKDPAELENMSNEDLLEAYESAVGFAG